MYVMLARLNDVAVERSYSHERERRSDFKMSWRVRYVEYYLANLLDERGINPETLKNKREYADDIQTYRDDETQPTLSEELRPLVSFY